jgi:GNAT superfamily N-acetyltransferase
MTIPPDMLAFEAASVEYLHARVAAVLSLDSNPYGAAMRSIGTLHGFLVRATPSPMVNRICGDPRTAPEVFDDLLEWFTEHECTAAIPLIVPNRRPMPKVMVGKHVLRRMNGWTHLQFAASINGASRALAAARVEEITKESIDAFCAIHADAFHTPPAGQPVSRAAFAGLLAGNSAKGFIVRMRGEPVAGAIVYFAKNGVAYLATAATRPDARGRGCHVALIAARLNAAREHGSQFVASTAAPNSQSRRNLERFGLTASHMQSLYRMGR